MNKEQQENSLCHPESSTHIIRTNEVLGTLKAASPLPIGGNIQVVGLPADGYDPPGGLAVTITGWGATATSNQSPPFNLMKVDITVIDRASLVARFGATDRMICAGEAGKSTCYGDSGGPLVSGGTQVGIVSWGREYCETDGGVHTNVGHLRSWITAAAGV
ncbi:uncharacterized protein LOC126484796 [Schistocerca serialis cubense]|uniref:uncharacterized protein LOC126484796 n=1 Tax=Schistocerca serialis cubense TaxID=2023355 RepID=UPI00214EFE0C|nr:uncharacterized protein LOC126484796 [Schistocerca serialis cubense]